MDNSLYVYPWDVLDDPAAPDEIAALQVGQVTLAAVYHSTRAFSPHNPQRKLVNAEYAASYFAPDPARYAGARLRPVTPAWLRQADSFERAARALQEVGQKVHAWVVVCHNSFLGQANPDLVVRNAFGDPYLYALCPAQPAVREYAATLIADLASRYPLTGLELEACGYMGIEHASHHDKSGLRFDLFHKFLISLCFCTACTQAMSAYGLDPLHLREQVVRALETFFNGESAGTDDPVEADDRLADLFGAKVWAQWAVMRDAITFGLVDTIRAQGLGTQKPFLTLYAHSSRHQTGACIGADLGGLAARADALMLALYGESPANAVAHIERMVQSTAGRTRVFGGLRAMVPDASSQTEFVARARAVKQAGAQGIRYYHYGLCPRPNLAWITAAVAATQTHA